MTETSHAKDRPRDDDRPPIEYRRTAYHQFVEEDRERLDKIHEDVQALTRSLNDFATNLEFYFRAWLERR